MPTTQSQPDGRQKRPLSNREKIELARQHVRTAHQYTRGVQKQVAPFIGLGLLVLASAALNAAKDATEDDATLLGSTAARCVWWSPWSPP
jgi:hypothetical protein